MAYQQQGQMGGPPPGYQGGPPPGQGGPPPGHMGGPPPGQGPPPGHMGGPPPGQMGGPPPGYQGGPPPGHMGGPPPGQGPPPGHMGGPPPGHMGGPPPGQGPPGHMGGPPPGHPQGPAPGQPWQPGMGGPIQGAPSQPPMDNPNAPPPPMAGQPSMSGFQQYNGYENVGPFGQAARMPPPPPPPPPSGPPPPMDFKQTDNMTEQACRDAMFQFVSENCCYGKKPAQEMKINKIDSSNALHYILETYCENRHTGYVHEPYRGGPVDGPENGMPPPPWQIPCQPNEMFVNGTKKLEVPHTATVKPCHHCDARGWNRCHRCDGCGQVRCHTCSGSGQTTRHDPEAGPVQQPCHGCHGDGRRGCSTCGADGRITCKTCQGHRQLKCYIELTVNFVNHKEDHIMEGTDMPDELVREVSGTLLFEQVMPQVWPIVAFPVAEINQNSQRLVDKHRGSFPNERRLNQRQQLKSVPVTECAYTWEEANTRFWVYGLQRKVHAPDYPQQCCWGCQIL